MRYRVARAVSWLVVVGLPFLVWWALSGDPVNWTKDRWYDLTNELVTVPDDDIESRLAAGQPLSQFDPEGASDGTDQAWAVNLPAQASGEACDDGAPAPDVLQTTIVLTLDSPADIREVVVYGGTSEDAAQRGDRLPKLVVVSYAGRCQDMNLPEEATDTTISLADPVPTDTVRVGIVSAYPADGDEQGPVIVREILLRARPD